MGIDGDGGSAEELDKIFIGESKERYFQVESQLLVSEKEELVKFLKDNIDVFAWTTYDVLVIDPEFICHHLNKNGKWRVCVDFTDLNKACPKDPFPIPRIDQLVDATVGHPRMSFLDAFQGYHQIPMSLSDQEKTAFHAPNGNYHYRVMHFGLKNVGSTYQRMVTRMFELQLGHNMEAYIDDMVIKSKKVGDHLRDLQETFSVFRRMMVEFKKPVYYISKSLQEAERRYLPLEKALLAIVHATRKLPHYFQAHTIVVLTQFPLQAIMRKSDYTSHVAKWGTRLGAYDVKYMSRTAIKGQVLADFVAEFTEGGIRQEDVMLVVMSIGLRSVLLWEVYMDGACNRKGAGIGIVLITPEKLVMEKSLRLRFVATNNEAKYEALLAGAQMVRHLGGEIVEL
ncbi:uncharacterized protein LOC142606572 [Castanea sativa]|uniref:uncharacterized protein LOC142606572 n=1 Tax=Castanea sativa TaxID=21020 RepID=UPI003F653CEA